VGAWLEDLVEYGLLRYSKRLSPFPFILITIIAKKIYFCCALLVQANTMGPLPSTFVQMTKVNFTGVVYSLFLTHFWFEAILYQEVYFEKNGDKKK
jgi:hypothetical protein